MHTHAASSFPGFPTWARDFRSVLQLPQGSPSLSPITLLNMFTKCSLLNTPSLVPKRYAIFVLSVTQFNGKRLCGLVQFFKTTEMPPEKQIRLTPDLYSHAFFRLC
ncbi:unnamed protein product [Ixodes pacificus]